MRVILPGSYDPVTLGHLEIIKRASQRYDEVFVVAFINPDKEYTFTLDERVKMLILATDELPNVLVSYSLGTVVDYMREHGIKKIVKGYRNNDDLEYELRQAEHNKKHGGYDTELIKCDCSFEDISSTAARAAIESSAPLEKFLPHAVIDFIKNR